MKNIAVFASHGGSDLQALINGCNNKLIEGRVCVVISNNFDSFALLRARDASIDHYCINAKVFPNENELISKILEVLESHQVDIIFLAGYLKKIDISILKKYKNKIFNIHPALLPKFGGKGMYGMNVHRAVIEAKEKFSGVTVHRVDEEYDVGDIVAQTIVEIQEGDTPETLQEKILIQEHIFLVEVLNNIILDKI